ncbi:MAG TPA: PEPxxWA-CTERM sorting domain-containing protein [Chthoniobacterales bacterium]|nr:PEPxxWA-CTERM sorting domain-containing protein [Chthoniobacterales bacterium]
MRKSILWRGLSALAFAATLPLATAAHADVYVFDLSGPNTASFMLDSSPTPSSTTSSYFDLQNVAGTYNGSPATFADIFFFTGSFDGGFAATGVNLNLVGTQLFTGTLTNPTFKLGTFALCDCSFGTPNYSLSITSGAVPEPATWAMMLIGFGAIGLTMRRRKTATLQLA